ncbi:MAG: protease modulator HflC [Alphaproteobacteria bacterium]|nr:protease modulator HflC [Alphaproteobacteria bacterium]
MRAITIALGVVVAGLLLAWNFIFFTVDQTEQALVVEFGSPKRVITQAGLNVYLPWQSVIKFEKRVLDLDAESAEVTSSDQKRLVVDAFARYRIVDPLKFYQTVNNKENADLRLGAILNSNIRVTLAGRSFQAVLSSQRAELMHIIRDETNQEAKGLGIEVVDVRIRKADLPQANSEAIFKRMQTDRQREAADIRAKGSQLGQEITADADRQATIIEANATKEASILRGQGESVRNKIFADAFSRDPGFFEFYRSMQAYAASMSGSNTTMVLSPDSKFFSYFKTGPGRGQPQ